MWYFVRISKGSLYIYNKKRVYVNWNYFDRKRFEYMYKKYVDEKKNEKVINNHSEDGYNYLIQAVEKHRNDCSKMAQQSMDDATEVYVNSYKNLYNSVKY